MCPTVRVCPLFIRADSKVVIARVCTSQPFIKAEENSVIDNICAPQPVDCSVEIDFNAALSITCYTCLSECCESVDDLPAGNTALLPFLLQVILQYGDLDLSHCRCSSGQGLKLRQLPEGILLLQFHKEVLDMHLYKA